MDIQELEQLINEEVKIIHSASFNIEVIDTDTVPAHDDQNITYANFGKQTKKVKKLATCILYIDIRKSTKISLQNDAETMVKLYTSFTRSMIKIAEFHGGKVRAIIGDRIMVVFDYITCGQQSIKTALAMNKIAKTVLNRHFKEAHIRCGIGIDCGEVLVTKCGVIKHSSDNVHYKELTWSGSVANTASKLTDVANSSEFSSKIIEGAKVGFNIPNFLGGGLRWEFQPTKKVIEDLKEGVTYSSIINHPNNSFSTLFYATQTKTDYISFPPILLTEAVLNDTLNEEGGADYLKSIMYNEIKTKIDGVTGKIFGIK